MTLIVLFVLFSVVFIGSIVGPKVYRQYLEDKDRKEREKLLSNIMTVGSIEQKERVKQIRDRERSIQLKLIERDQAARILESPSVRAELENANVDVIELKRLLQNSSEDSVLGEYKLLEQELQERKNEN